MQFEGDVWSAFTRFDINEGLTIPRPKTWASIEAKLAGAKISPLWGGLAPPRIDPSILLPRAPTKSPGSSSNSGSTTLHFTSVDVRPRYRHKIGPVHLVVSAEYAGEEIEGTWHSTASNVSGVASGVFSVRVASQPLVRSRAARG